MWARVHHAVGLNRAGRSPHSRPQPPTNPDPARPPTPPPAPPPPRLPAPARPHTHHPRPHPYAVEMPISVSNLRFCNRKWHLREEPRGGRVETHAKTHAGTHAGTHACSHAPAPYRVPVPAHPACPYRCAVEMPISVSNLRFCNRKWHLGREHGERAGEVAREEVGRGSAGGRGRRSGEVAREEVGGRPGCRACGHGTRHSALGTRHSALGYVITTIVSPRRTFDGIPGPARVDPGDFGLPTIAR